MVDRLVAEQAASSSSRSCSRLAAGDEDRQRLWWQVLFEELTGAIGTGEQQRGDPEAGAGVEGLLELVEIDRAATGVEGTIE